MALHPQCKAFLDILASGDGKPLEQLPVEEARLMSAGLSNFGGPEEPVAEVQNRTVPGPGGPCSDSRTCADPKHPEVVGVDQVRPQTVDNPAKGQLEIP